MDIEELKQILEEAWREPPMMGQVEEPEKTETKRKRKILFLGERTVEPENPVLFENGVFFVERASRSLVIRPKTVKRYLKEVRGTRRTIEIEKGAKEILIPLSQTRENPMRWFEERYEPVNAKRNEQGRFIREIWKYRNEVFSEVMIG